MTIRELRERLQGPRRQVDTFYGRYVMRRFSIYLTMLFSYGRIHPNWVNFLSIISGCSGAWLLSSRHWLSGILLVNGWYLLDHVDGEVARLRKISSATGLYLDTIANPIVFPATFFTLGIGLSKGGLNGWIYMGVVAAYGSLMMIVAPFCESMVVLKRFQQGRLKVTNGKVTASRVKTITASPLKKIFSLMHECATFPVFLPVATLLILGFSWVDRWLLESGLKVLLVVYAVILNVVWISIVAHTVITNKIDKNYPPASV